jgi:hypothetical protein
LTSTAQIPQPKFLRTVATALSYILHPIFIPVYVSLALYMLAPLSFAGVSRGQFYQWLGVIVVSMVFFPLLSILLMKALGFIKSILMPDTKDRIIPLMATMIFYFWASHAFNSFGEQGDKHVVAPLILKVLMLGSFWGVIAIFMCNIFFKISMHSAAAGSMVGIFIVLMLSSPVNMAVPFFIVLAIAGLMGTVRLILYTHTMAEIVIGYILGILVMLGAYWYM